MPESETVPEFRKLAYQDVSADERRESALCGGLEQVAALPCAVDPVACRVNIRATA